MFETIGCVLNIEVSFFCSEVKIEQKDMLPESRGFPCVEVLISEVPLKGIS